MSYRKVIEDYATQNPIHAASLMGIMERSGWPLFRDEKAVMYYSNTSNSEQPAKPSQLLDLVQRDTSSGMKAVCVVENISPAIIQLLGCKWAIAPSFFAEHANNLPRAELWAMQSFSSAPKDSRHLDGVYQYKEIGVSDELMRLYDPNYCRRHIYQDSDWPLNVSTRVSYCKPFPTIYLFLVDSPIEYSKILESKHQTPPRHGPSLHMTYSRNYGGIVLPPAAGTSQCNLFGALASTFGHWWQVSYIFESDDTFPTVPFLYLMSNSLWESNLRDLDRRMRHISFRSIRRPKVETADILHDMREDLAILRDNLDKTIWYVRPDVKAYFEDLANVSSEVASRRNPLQRLPTAVERADKLHGFFVETFNILVNTIAVYDSQASLAQARQGTFLTQLAALYLPLSVATGVFGMNLAEINGATPRVWAFIVTLMGLLFLTLGAYFLGTRTLLPRHGIKTSIPQREEHRQTHSGV